MGAERSVEREAPHRQYMSLQAGRGLAALLIVAQHASTFAGVVPGMWVHPAISRWLMGLKAGVAFFFVLSGVVILTAHWEDLGRPASVGLYVWKRVRRIYPIYWVVLIAVLCVQLHGAARGAMAFRRDPWVIVSSFLLVHVHSEETNLVVAWTLFVEVMFYAVFVTMLLSRRVGAGVLAAWFVMSAMDLLHRPRWHETLFSPLHLLFAMGIAVAWMLRQRRVRYASGLLTAGAAVLAATLVYGGWRGAVQDELYLVSGAGAALALLGAAELERSGRLRVPRWMSFLGDASYAIYLIHDPVVSAAAHVGFRLDARVHWPIAVWMAIFVGLGTVAGCALHVWVERPLLGWMGARRGSRYAVPGEAA